MKIGFSTSVIQRGKTGVAQYVFALLRAMLAHADKHEFNLFVLEEDLPLFDFAKEKMNLIPVAEKFRPAVKNVLWHQTELPKLAKNLKGRDIDLKFVNPTTPVRNVLRHTRLEEYLLGETK